MHKLIINGKITDSELLIGERLQNAFRHIPDKRIVIITDTNVRNLYLKEFPAGDIITIGCGEAIKNLDTVRDIYHQLVDLKADRSTYIIGIGGGIVCDICGFAASTYMRGLRFAYVPTTLLAQVDAGVGGKSGVNLGGYKNLVGVFNQPEFVLCDANLLKSLPQREVLCGMAEIIKHAAIADVELLEFLEHNRESVIKLDVDVIEKLIYDSVLIKSKIVNRDETEKGERRKLNFGHTFGHAIEKCTDFNHGEAVSVGMALACAFSVQKGIMAHAGAKRLKLLLESFGLPTRVDVRADMLLEAIEKDKKRLGDIIHFVLLKGLGNARVEEISMDELKHFADSGLQASN